MSRKLHLRRPVALALLFVVAASLTGTSSASMWKRKTSQQQDWDDSYIIHQLGQIQGKVGAIGTFSKNNEGGGYAPVQKLVTTGAVGAQWTGSEGTKKDTPGPITHKNKVVHTYDATTNVPSSPQPFKLRVNVRSQFSTQGAAKRKAASPTWWWNSHNKAIARNPKLKLTARPAVPGGPGTVTESDIALHPTLQAMLDQIAGMPAGAAKDQAQQTYDASYGLGNKGSGDHGNDHLPPPDTGPGNGTGNGTSSTNWDTTPSPQTPPATPNPLPAGPNTLWAGETTIDAQSHSKAEVIYEFDTSADGHVDNATITTTDELRLTFTCKSYTPMPADNSLGE